jgi:hypothetical protein
MGLLEQFGGLLEQFNAYKAANTPRNTRPQVSPAKVFNEGLLNPNQYNAPAANRFKDSAFGALGIVPGVGDAAAGAEAADLWNRGDKGMAALAGVGMLPLIPSMVGLAKRPVNALGEAIQPTRFELNHEAAQRNAVEMLGLPPDNTAMDRARAMGAVDVYHGSASDIQQIDPAMYGSSTGAKSAKDAFWAVSDPTTAGGYAEYAARQAPVKRLLDDADRFEKAGNWDGYEEALSLAERLETELYNDPLRGQNIMPLMAMPRKPAVMDAKGAEFVDVEGGVNKFLRSARIGGKDAAVFKNMADDVGRNARPADHYAILNPSAIRSRFAAFDPAKRDSTDLLAGLAPYIGIGGLLSLGLLTPEEAQAR